jgi:uncharacterized protein
MKKGFTLIELLVVIAVIAILSVGVILLVGASSGSSSSSDGQVGTAASINIPTPSNYLVDEAGALNQDTVMKLNSELQAFDTNSKNIEQIGVLIVTSTQPDTIEQYSIAVAQNWKVGYKGSNNGILFTLATIDRTTRIEVGTDLEGTLTDVQAEDMLQQYAVPYFKTGDWNGGVTAVVEALINKLSSN